MSPPAREQLAVVALALALWSLFARPELWALACAYGAAWLVVWLVSLAWPAWRTTPIRVLPACALAAAIAAAPTVALVRALPTLAEREDLAGLPEITRDRLRLERTPSIAPAIIASDRPQTFWIHAPGATRVSLRLGAGVRALATDALGHDLFRAHYDPRRDGTFRATSGYLDATVVTDTDRASRTLIAAAPLAHPRSLDVAPDGNQLVTTSEETDELAIIDARTGTMRRVPVGDAPIGAVFVLGGRAIAVAHRQSPELWLIDVTTGRTSARIGTDLGAASIAASPSSNRVALAHADGVRVIELADGGRASVTTLPVAAAVDWVAFGRDDDELVASTRRPAALHRFTATATATAPPHTWREPAPAISLGAPAVTLTRSRDGTRAWLATTDLRPNGTANLGNHFIQDQLVTIDLAHWRIAGSFPTERRTSRQTRAGDIDRGASPLGLAERADGKLLVAFAGTDDVWLWRPDAGARPWIVGLDADTLSAPHAVAPLGDGGFAVTSPSSGTVGIFDARAELRRLVRLAPSDAALLRNDELALRRRWGERVFYEAARAGISCQSCHLHGTTDLASHNLGDRRPVPTLDVRGIAGTAPYLRDGSYPRLVDLVTIADRFRGYRTQIGDRAVMLAAYLESLPPRAASPHADRNLARERRGVAAFVRARCVTCHAFPAFTNLGSHAIRTIFPDTKSRFAIDELVDTPSLLGVGASAPFLADGRAPSLAAVIRAHNRENAHGDVASLSRSTEDDLLYFLERL